MTREEKRLVRGYYDTVGWRTTETGRYGDTEAFVDNRRVTVGYHRRKGHRVKRFMRMPGHLLLDAGCGANPQSTVLGEAWPFDRQVCVDVSRTGLLESRRKLGDRGAYVQADLTQLPFRDGAFESIVSAHAVYHIPADEQEAAVWEMWRALSAGGRAVIIYSRANSRLTRLATTPTRQWLRELAGLSRLRTMRARAHLDAVEPQGHSSADQKGPSLYFHAHEYPWFERNFPRAWSIDVRCWSSLSTEATAKFAPDNVLGRALLWLVWVLEEAFPHAMVRLGQYPMIVITKS